MAPDQESVGDKVEKDLHEPLNSEICSLGKLSPLKKPILIEPADRSKEKPNGVTNSCNGTNTVVEDGIPVPDVQLYPPGQVRLEWMKPQKVGAGLVNLGNTCFLNTVIQCLTYCPPLANYLLHDDHTASCKSFEFCMMCELQKHIKQALQHSGDVIKPLHIYQNLKFIADHFQFGRQEDAHEFLRFVIENLWRSSLYSHGEDEMLDPASRETTIINHIFGGYNRSQVVCLRCKKKSDKYEHFMDFILDIKHNAYSLEKALEQFVQPELLENDNAYKCPNCNMHVPAEKTFTIHRAPNVATIQLKRFDYNKSYGGKITKHVSYPEKLNLRPFMSENSTGYPLVYKLNAVLVHVGQNCNSGHYFCYVRNSNGYWYLMDDARVQRVGIHEVLNQQAYVLFYVRLPTQNGTQFKKNGISSVINGKNLKMRFDGRGEKKNGSPSMKYSSPNCATMSLESKFQHSCSTSSLAEKHTSNHSYVNGNGSESFLPHITNDSLSNSRCRDEQRNSVSDTNGFYPSESCNGRKFYVFREERPSCNGIDRRRNGNFSREYDHEEHRYEKVPFDRSCTLSDQNFQPEFEDCADDELPRPFDYNGRTNVSQRSSPNHYSKADHVSSVTYNHRYLDSRPNGNNYRHTETGDQKCVHSNRHNENNDWNHRNNNFQNRNGFCNHYRMSSNLPPRHPMSYRNCNGNSTNHFPVNGALKSPQKRFIPDSRENYSYERRHCNSFIQRSVSENNLHFNGCDLHNDCKNECGQEVDERTEYNHNSERNFKGKRFYSESDKRNWGSNDRLKQDSCVENSYPEKRYSGNNWNRKNNFRFQKNFSDVNRYGHNQERTNYRKCHAKSKSFNGTSSFNQSSFQRPRGHPYYRANRSHYNHERSF